MSLHLCEVIIRDTKESIKFYEIELVDRPFYGSVDWDAIVIARRRACNQFEQELKYTPSLRKLINDRDWCVDSVVIS